MTIRIFSHKKFMICNAFLLPKTIDEGMTVGLYNLEILSMGTNSIESIAPASFQNTTALINIGLDNNRLESLPQTLFSTLINLQRLSLNKNLLHTIEAETFKQNTALIKLNLDNNRLENVSQNLFSTLINLQELSLNKNFLHMIEADTFKNNTALTKLFLNDNLLQSLPESMWDPQNHPSGLNEFEVRHCVLSKVAYYFSGN